MTGIGIFPVTVGRLCVRFISTSRSTSYQLLNINAPAITSVLPPNVNKNKLIFEENVAPVKYKANKNPVNTGNTFKIKTNILVSDLISAKTPDILPLLMSFVSLVKSEEDFSTFFTPYLI